jgi:hypothetical protein
MTRRLTIAVVLTIVDVAACSYYCGVIWQAFARDLFAKASLLGLLCLWVASAVVIWGHVANDLHQSLRDRSEGLALNSLRAPSRLRRDSNV